MKTEAEIKAEIRYFEGVLNGLDCIGDKTNAEEVEKNAQAKLDILKWVLARSVRQELEEK
jgi:hypothetical protein